MVQKLRDAKNCTSAPVRKMMRVQPRTIKLMVMTLNAAVSMGRAALTAAARIQGLVWLARVSAAGGD